MPLDPGLVELLRDDLADTPGISERKMFGGIAFMQYGNMMCGVSKDGLMFRVGKAAEAEALAMPHVRPLGFTGRPMGGFVEVGPEAAEDAPRDQLLALALAYCKTLPPKGRLG
jgi:hypothetical protein